jgi:hypothetical protein
MLANVAIAVKIAYAIANFIMKPFSIARSCRKMSVVERSDLDATRGVIGSGWLPRFNDRT